MLGWKAELEKLSLKVLMATSSKSPSISLNISQYLSKYVFFKVSPSLMDKDNKEANGRGTLLQVMKRASNAWVSSSKELIESALKLSKHLIATCPKLDGNTLHISGSFFECTAIFWLKWLTCSIGSVLPLYRVKRWMNWLGSLPSSILHVKGDLEICLRALLKASFPKPLVDECRSLWSRRYSLTCKKDSLGGVLDLCL